MGAFCLSIKTLDDIKINLDKKDVYIKLLEEDTFKLSIFDDTHDDEDEASSLPNGLYVFDDEDEYVATTKPNRKNKQREKTDDKEFQLNVFNF